LVSGAELKSVNERFNSHFIVLFTINLILIKRWISYKKRELFTFASIWIHFRFLVRSVFSIVLVFLWVVFLFCLSSSVLCPMLPVSLDCPFLITSSVFSNVYFFIFIELTPTAKYQKRKVKSNYYTMLWKRIIQPIFEFEILNISLANIWIFAWLIL
jgi:hypothetical protein